MSEFSHQPKMNIDLFGNYLIMEKIIFDQVSIYLHRTTNFACISHMFFNIILHPAKFLCILGK